MRAIWKGSISFGLVNIPVALGIARQRQDPRFRTLHKPCGTPIKQQLYCPTHDKVVERDETVKGYEFSKGHFVEIDDQDLERLSPEKRRTIDLVAFADMDEVDPVYYDTTYYLDPLEHAQKPYALLLRALEESGKVALGTFVLSTRQYFALLRPAGGMLAVETLFFPEDVRSADHDEIELRVASTEVKKAELEMARELVESQARPFDPSEFANEHRQAVMDMIEAKVDGREVIAVEEVPEAKPVPDLMAALKQSLADAKGEKRGAAPKKPATSKNAAPKKKSASKPAAKRKPAAKKKGAAKPKPTAKRKPARPKAAAR